MDFIDPILSIASKIYTLVETVEANRKCCQRVCDRVRGLEELVRKIQKSDNVEQALKELYDTLESAQELIKKYTSANLVKRTLNSSSHKDKFDRVNDRLNDAFQFLSGALQVEHGSMIYKMFELTTRQREDEMDRRADDAELKTLLLEQQEKSDIMLRHLEEVKVNVEKVVEKVVEIHETREAPPVNTCEAPLTSVSRFGDIMKVETTGASVETAQQDKLQYSGVKASYAMAEIDMIEMRKYKPIINNTARQTGLDPALIAAMISRSCRAGKTLTDGKGCYDEKRQEYDTFGLMQINVNPNGGGHKPRGSWDSEEHLCHAMDILMYFIVRIKTAFPDWSKEQQLKGGIAAYNAGDGNIRSYTEVDARTSGRDYSNDVVARAHWYKTEGGF